jgi:hypothetical protein
MQSRNFLLNFFLITAKIACAMTQLFCKKFGTITKFNCAAFNKIMQRTTLLRNHATFYAMFNKNHCLHNDPKKFGQLQNFSVKLKKK